MSRPSTQENVPFQEAVRGNKHQIADGDVVAAQPEKSKHNEDIHEDEYHHIVVQIRDMFGHRNIQPNQTNRRAHNAHARGTQSLPRVGGARGEHSVNSVAHAVSFRPHDFVAKEEEAQPVRQGNDGVDNAEDLVGNTASFVDDNDGLAAPEVVGRST